MICLYVAVEFAKTKLILSSRGRQEVLIVMARGQLICEFFEELRAELIRREYLDFVYQRDKS